MAGHPRDAQDVDFDEGNEAELAAHRISPSEAVQVIANSPVWAPNKKGRAGLWLAIGYTGRWSPIDASCRLRRN